jgi:ABC-2 type transport system ATP-binding protein
MATPISKIAPLVTIATFNLCKNFGNVNAVVNLNLSIPHGVTYGLLGPNGAGKTTTVRMLNAIIPPSGGRAIVAGFDVVKNSVDVKRHCGFLPESPGLYEKLTAFEFLEFIGELYEVPKDILYNRIEELLDLFELRARANDLLEGYSRGMKQKVCLCSTLVQDPQIIFLDEPTSNLDPEAARMVKDLILQLAKRANKTIFLCTHLLNAAEELCDIIGIIKEGKLVIEGTPKQLIAHANTDNLEEAYLKIMGTKKTDELLAWRENGRELKFDKKNRYPKVIP